VVAGCDEAPTSGAGAIPVAAELGADAIGYYCNMTVADHPGPKGQAFVAGKDAPLWFSSVRDTLAFTRLPGEPKNIAALYVNDMGRMGAPEVVPFAEREAAGAFAARHGGTVLDFSSVPDDAVIGAVVAEAGDGRPRASMQAANDHVQHVAAPIATPVMQAMQTGGSHAHQAGEGHAHEAMTNQSEVSR